MKVVSLHGQARPSAAIQSSYRVKMSSMEQQALDDAVGVAQAQDDVVFFRSVTNASITTVTCFLSEANAFVEGFSTYGIISSIDIEGIEFC